MLSSLRTGSADEIAWFGIPPTRVDILRTVSGGDFAAAYASRVDADWEGVAVSIVGLDTLIALNARADASKICVTSARSSVGRHPERQRAL